MTEALSPKVLKRKKDHEDENNQLEAAIKRVALDEEDDEDNEQEQNQDHDDTQTKSQENTNTDIDNSVPTTDDDTEIHPQHSQSYLSNTSNIINNNTDIIHLRMLCLVNQASLVVGHKGEMISKIKQQTNSRINVSDNSKGIPERVIYIRGTCENVAKAFGMIVRAILGRNTTNSNSSSNNVNVENIPITINILVPHHMMGCIIGKQGSHLREIEDLSAARLFASPQQLIVSNDRMLSITGVADAIHIASFYIGQSLLNASDQLKKRNTIFYQPSPMYSVLMNSNLQPIQNLPLPLSTTTNITSPSSSNHHPSHRHSHSSSTSHFINNNHHNNNNKHNSKRFFTNSSNNSSSINLNDNISIASQDSLILHDINNNNNNNNNTNNNSPFTHSSPISPTNAINNKINSNVMNNISMNNSNRLFSTSSTASTASTYHHHHINNNNASLFSMQQQMLQQNMLLQQQQHHHVHPSQQQFMYSPYNSISYGNPNVMVQHIRMPPHQDFVDTPQNTSTANITLPPNNLQHRLSTSSSPSPISSYQETRLTPQSIIKQDIYIDERYVGNVIGKEGKHINSIKETTGCSIYIDKPIRGANERKITIKGTSMGLQASIMLINNRIETDRLSSGSRKRMQ